MISLQAKTRKDFGKKTKSIKKNAQIPAVVYGPGVKNFSIQVEEGEFKKVFRKAGESSLIELSIEGEKEKKPVLIHEMQKDPVSDKVVHIDFYKADLKEQVEVAVPLVFEDLILVKDLVLPKDVVSLKKPEEIVASVLPPQKVEEELATEIKENVEDIEKVVKEKKEEDVVAEVKEEKKAE